MNINFLKYKATFLKVSIFICLINLITIPFASAVTGVYNESFYSNNDILFYNPEASSCSGQTSSSVSLTGDTNAQKIWNWLKAQGLTNEQAAGVMGNIKVESASTFSPTIQQINQPWPTTGWGLAQWTGGRRTAIASALSSQNLGEYYAAKYGSVPPTDSGGRHPDIPEDINIKLLDFELNYMMQESQGRRVSRDVASQGYGTAGDSEWDTLKKQATIEAATVFWHNNFEVSADTPAEVIKNRGGAAQDAFNSFSNQTASTVGSSSTACGSTTSTTGNFSETVKAYAWPEYHAKPYTQMMPAYQAAITKAKSEGRYVGSNGIDCGGFVTTLMFDSGFDPTYNSNGRGGATDDQQQWLEAHWDNLGRGNTINTADLRPGDVAMLPGHTFVFVGHIDGFNSTIASASLNERSPMAGEESLTASNITWYRKKG